MGGDARSARNLCPYSAAPMLSIAGNHAARKPREGGGPGFGEVAPRYQLAVVDGCRSEWISNRSRVRGIENAQIALAGASVGGVCFHRAKCRDL
jgi:hypothetical protein